MPRHIRDIASLHRIAKLCPASLGCNQIGIFTIGPAFSIAFGTGLERLLATSRDASASKATKHTY